MSAIPTPSIASTIPQPTRFGMWRPTHFWPELVFWTCVLLILSAVVAMTLSLSQRRTIGSTWADGPGHSIQLQATKNPALVPHLGQSLVAVSLNGDSPLTVGSDARYPTGRWDVYADQRRHTQGFQRQLNQLLEQPKVRLHFATGAAVEVLPQRLGIRNLGLGYWILTGLAASLLIVAARVVSRRPMQANYVYALLSCGYVMNLIMMAGIATGDLTAPVHFVEWDYTIRSIADLLTVSAMVQAQVLHPVPMPKRQWMAALSWLVAALPMALLPWIEQWHWWVVRGVTGSLGTLALWLAYHGHQETKHPLGMFFSRAGTATLGIWLLLSVATAITAHNGGAGLTVASIGTVLWTVFFALFLLLLPFLARSKQIVREFTLLAAITTVAAVLHLICVSAFGMDALTALILAVLVAVTAYTMTRQWLLDRSVGRRAANTERIFEQIYITLEEAQSIEERPPELADSLLRSVFDPQSTELIERNQLRARVSRDGSMMTVPLPSPHKGAPQDDAKAVRLRNAHQGQRLFTLEDARMADHIVDQLNHALAFQLARDQGRREERLRLAQDLHDDIGARLLTLMYKAPSAEIEEYIRHTLQDLKTLTRGLASGRHRLSNAVGEWRTDAGHRLEALRCELDWHNDLDTDVELTVVQWSTLTRVLRELVSNVIAHSQATQVDVRIALQQGTFRLQITDDGVGQSPQSWAHGLGLGGIRKRIKQLEGQVEWSAEPSGGVTCTIQIANFAPPPASRISGTGSTREST